MMLFWKAGLVMLAVPKTGTQAFEQALSSRADIVMRHPTPMKHINAARFRNKLLPLIDPRGKAQLKTLAVIREPLDWLGSWYRYRRRPQLSGHLNSTENVTFDQFVDAYLSDEPPAFARVGSQARFVSDSEGRVLADFLFPYEDQQRLRDFLSRRLGAEVMPPVRNVSPDMSITLSHELRARLLADRQADFDLHGKVSAGQFLPI